MIHYSFFSTQNNSNFISKKTFRTQTNDQSILADKTNNVWQPQWCHLLFFSKLNDISSEAIATISVHRDYLGVNVLLSLTDTLKYNTIVNDRTSNNSLISNFIKTQETLNGTINLTQQDIQTPSHFVNEEIVESLPTTTQQNFPPFAQNLRHHTKKNPRITIQLTVKPSVVPKYSQMGYQT